MPTFIVNIYERTWAFTKYEVIYIDTDAPSLQRTTCHQLGQQSERSRIPSCKKMVEEWQLAVGVVNAFVTYIVDKQTTYKFPTGGFFKIG